MANPHCERCGRKLDTAHWRYTRECIGDDLLGAQVPGWYVGPVFCPYVKPALDLSHLPVGPGDEPSEPIDI